MRLKNLLGSVIAITAGCLLTCAYADSSVTDILVTQSWVQAMPASQTTSAAYMTIENKSPNSELVLVSASSDIADAVELHQMSEMNGMMKMAKVSDIRIPAQSKVSLGPGGFHIMLINLKKPVNKGDIIPITLHFHDGRAIMVKVEARDDQPEDSSSMPGMKM